MKDLLYVGLDESKDSGNGIILGKFDERRILATRELKWRLIEVADKHNAVPGGAKVFATVNIRGVEEFEFMFEFGATGSSFEDVKEGHLVITNEVQGKFVVFYFFHFTLQSFAVNFEGRRACSLVYPVDDAFLITDSCEIELLSMTSSGKEK